MLAEGTRNIQHTYNRDIVDAEQNKVKIQCMQLKASSFRSMLPIRVSNVVKVCLLSVASRSGHDTQEHFCFKDLYLEFDQDPQQSEQCETTW